MIFEIQTNEVNHEGPFYIKGQGAKGWAAVVPPWGFQLNPPPTEGVQGVLDPNSYFLSYFLPNFSYIQPASYISYILGLPPLSFSLPRRPRIPPGRPKMSVLLSCWALFFDFLAFKKIVGKMLRKNIEKSAKIEVFGLPKPSQNHPK